MRENIAYGRPDAGLEEVAAAARAANAHEFIERLADGYETRLGDDGMQLSGGQRQRIALIRALALHPKTLLLDEPLGALDPMIRADLQLDLKRIFSELDQTVVFVTHDMGEAERLCDRLAVIHRGGVRAAGTVAEVRAAAGGAPDLETAFFRLLGEEAA